MPMLNSSVFVIGILIFYILSCINILNEYERGVIFRLGRVLDKPKGPGLIFVLWPIDRMVRMSLRLVTLDVPPQDVITRDNVSAKINAVVYYRVMEAIKATIEVELYDFAVSQMAQTTLRSVLGQAELDTLLSEREQINSSLQQIIDEQTEPWGVKVTVVEVKDVELPQTMQRAMARQAEAERERRAKVINADGEFQAAQRLADAGEIMATQPMTLQLRFLQTLTEVASEKNSTIVFPVPIDLIQMFMGQGQVAAAAGGGNGGAAPASPTTGDGL